MVILKKSANFVLKNDSQMSSSSFIIVALNGKEN